MSQKQVAFLDPEERARRNHLSRPA
jgi:hypothetical protein